MEDTLATEYTMEALHIFTRSSVACRMEFKDPLLESKVISPKELQVLVLQVKAVVLMEALLCTAM